MSAQLYFPEHLNESSRKVDGVTRSPLFLMGIVVDWIVCISVSAAESRTMETLKLIKAWRHPLPPKQFVTGRSPPGSTEAPTAARRRLEVPPLLRLCVTAAASQKDRQNPQKSMHARQQQQLRLAAAVVLVKLKFEG